jgi:hypothetical protein
VRPYEVEQAVLCVGLLAPEGRGYVPIAFHDPHDPQVSASLAKRRTHWAFSKNQNIQIEIGTRAKPSVPTLREYGDLPRPDGDSRRRIHLFSIGIWDE